MLDANDNLRLAGIFDISQRIAGEHAEIIGVYGANYAKILMDKKFPEWYLAHKNVSNSDLVAS